MQTDNTKLPISIFIVCMNEEQYIARLLSSCERFQEIIIVDSGSTDKTLEIAKQFPVKIFHHVWQGYAKQKQYALEQCSQDWVLNLDADEELNDELINQFVEIMQADVVDGVRCKRNDVFIGKLPACLTKKANNLRFYRRNKVKFDVSTLVHETAQLSGKEISIPQAFTHYGYDNINAVVDKNNQYSSLKALEKFQKNKNFSYFKLIFIFPLIFIKMYFLQGYIFSGMRGFILANSVAYYAFIKEAKLYELHKNPNT